MVAFLSNDYNFTFTLYKFQEILHYFQKAIHNWFDKYFL